LKIDVGQLGVCLSPELSVRSTVPLSTYLHDRYSQNSV
jgi:hypothetical protein